MGELNLPHIEVMFKENLGMHMLEGSRFVTRQIHRYLAGGSRKLPSVQNSPRVSDILETSFGQMIEKTHRGLFQGAACS